MKKAFLIFTALLISVPAMAQDKPLQVSDETIQEVQKEYAPIYCSSSSLEPVAKAVERCYATTNREDPAIEKCIWADLMVGTIYNTRKKVSIERGLPGIFILIPFLEIENRNKRNAYNIYTSKHFDYLSTIKDKQKYFSNKLQDSLDNFIQSCKQ